MFSAEDKKRDKMNSSSSLLSNAHVVVLNVLSYESDDDLPGLLFFDEIQGEWIEFQEETFPDQEESGCDNEDDDDEVPDLILSTVTDSDLDIIPLYVKTFDQWEYYGERSVSYFKNRNHRNVIRDGRIMLEDFVLSHYCDGAQLIIKRSS
jgi:hypothetical protein